MARGLADPVLRDLLVRLCNTLVRFLAKAVLDPIVWRTTRDWAAFKSGALDEVVFPEVETIVCSLGAVLVYLCGGWMTWKT